MKNLIDIGFYSKDEDSKKIKFENNIIKDVEIFRTGVFRKQLFEKEFVNALKQNYEAMLRDKVVNHVAVRAGHKGMFENSIENVVGYISDLKTVNKGKITVKTVTMGAEGEEIREEREIDDIRLVADFEITDKNAREKIESTTWRDRSVELMQQYESNDGEVYSPVLAGVAFVDDGEVEKLESFYEKEDGFEKGLNYLTFSKEQFADLKEAFSSEQEDEDGEGVDQDDSIVSEDKKDLGKDDTSEDKGEDEGEDDEKQPEDEEQEDDGKQTDGEEKDEVEDQGKQPEDKEQEDEDEDKEVKMSKSDLDELVELRKLKQEMEFEKKFEKLEVLQRQGYSTPAMLELEKKIVRKMYESGLNGKADAVFELFKEYKTATPRVWNKNENLKKIDDSSEKDNAKNKAKKNNLTGDNINKDDYRKVGRDYLKKAGFKAKNDN